MGTYIIGATKTLTAADTKMNDRYQKFLFLNNILFKNGYPNPLRGFVIAQVLHETNDFSSSLAKRGFNITGIKYSKNSPYQSGNDNGYAKYRSYDDWAKDLKRILQFNPGVPWNAVTITDYVNRLKKNRYFEDTTERYLNGVNRFILLNNEAIRWAKGVHNEMVKSPGQKIVNTEGWTAADDAAVQKQGKFNWNFETWSTEKKVVGAVSLLAGIILIKNLTS